MGSCVAGGLEFGAGLVRGHRHAPGVSLVCDPPIQACFQACQRCVQLSPLGREGSAVGLLVMRSLMPYRNSFPCHRIRGGPDTPPRFLCSIELLGLTGNDEHISFLHEKKIGKGEGKKNRKEVCNKSVPSRPVLERLNGSVMQGRRWKMQGHSH